MLLKGQIMTYYACIARVNIWPQDPKCQELSHQKFIRAIMVEDNISCLEASR